MMSRNIPKRVSILFLLAGAAFAILLSACVLPNTTAFLKPEQTTGESIQLMQVSADNIVLQWDASAGDVASYSVYYRTHGTSNWILLGDAGAAPPPQYGVPYAAMPGNGKYDFAVVAVGGSGQKSSYHTSLDPTASPSTGWYVSWQK
jgi:hypothetical protein